MSDLCTDARNVFFKITCRNRRETERAIDFANKIELVSDLISVEEFVFILKNGFELNVDDKNRIYFIKK